MQTRSRSFGIGEVRLRLSKGDGVILLVDDSQDVPRLDDLAFDDVDFLNLASNAGTQRHDVTIDLRIIGALVEEGVSKEVSAHTTQQDYRDDHKSFVLVEETR